MQRLPRPRLRGRRAGAVEPGQPAEGELPPGRLYGRSRHRSAAASAAPSSGTDALPAILFAVIGWSDYLDGITARVTGQYSRLGALLDPLVDRLLVLAGVVVCWHFELLPRWGLALLAVREVLMLILVRVAMVKHVDLPVNWLGRAGVFPVFGALFFGLAGVDWLAQALLYVGLVLIYGSLAQYVRAGLRQYRAQQG